MACQPAERIIDQCVGDAGAVREGGWPSAHPGLGAANHRAGAGRVGGRTDRRTDHARQARAGAEATTAARTHHPPAQGTAALRHADDRYRAATASQPLKKKPRNAGLPLFSIDVVITTSYGARLAE